MSASGAVTEEGLAVLAELEERDREDNSADTPRDRRIRCITRTMGALLHGLVLIRRPQRILELGTSAGYSTIWLASAARHVGSRVVTVEGDKPKQQWARANLQRAGLLDHVDLELGDAVGYCESDEGPWDFVFLDHSGSTYLATFKALADKIAPSGIIISDGWRSFKTWSTEAPYRDYMQYAMTLKTYTTILLPFEKGALVSIRSQRRAQTERDPL